MAKKKDPAKENTIPRRKSFLYKQATYAVEPFGQTLEDILNHAWNATTKLAARRQITSPDNQACILTNYRSQSYGMTFFEVLAFTPGMKALAANIDLEQASLDVEDVEVKNEAGKRLQLIENMLHVGVCKNHVVLLTSQALGSVELEMHLNWLLESVAVIEKPQQVRLSNRIKPDKQHEMRDIKSIHFWTELNMQPGEDKEKLGYKVFRPAGTSWAGIKALLQGLAPKMADVAEDMEVSGLTESTPVDVDILLKFPRPKKGQTNPALDKIATGLRHVDKELDYEIQTKNGTFTNKDFILKRPRTVHCRGERPVRDLLFKSMHEWLAELLSNKDVV